MNILVINGHPIRDSFSNEIANHISNDSCKILNLYDHQKILTISNWKDLNGQSPEIKNLQSLITWANHLIFIYPTWWWSMPGIMKTFIDMTFSSGFAFKYTKSQSIHNKLLNGKTASIVTTMDSPKWYAKWFMKSVNTFVLKKGILAFSGIKTREIHVISKYKFTKREDRIEKTVLDIKRKYSYL